MSLQRGGSVGPSIGDTVGGKYRLSKLIGQGGMGTVYQAEDLGLGRMVAVKFLQSRVAHDFGLVERFMREAKATAAIAHPRIVDVFDVGWTDDGQLPYFVMELLDGKNLTAELRASGPMAVDRAVGIVVQVLDALEAAHGKGFIHRDLKPENIFIIRHGLEEDVKVLDFGITKSIGGSDGASLTHTGAVLGTPAYMSPEQARGSREIDHRTDLYAAGAILYELITGRPPYEGETYNEIIIKIATQEPPPIQSLRPGLHPALAAVIHKTLARDPDKRWPTCAALAQALHEVLDDSHTSTGILAGVDAGSETTDSGLKPTPTAWEVTAPAPVPRGPRAAPAPLEEGEQIDSDPDERTRALVSRIAVPSPQAAAAWAGGPAVHVVETTDSALVVAEDTSSLPLSDDTSSLQLPEPSMMTGSMLAASTSSRSRTFAVLAIVGLVTGAATYLVGGWLLDQDDDPTAVHGAGPVVPPLDPPRIAPPPELHDPPRLPRVEPPRVAPPHVEPRVTAIPEPGVNEGTESPALAPPREPLCRVRASVVTPRATIVLDGSRAQAEIDLPSPCGSTHTLEVTAPEHEPRRVELTAVEEAEPRRVELVARPRVRPRTGDRPPRRGGGAGNPHLEKNPF